MHHFKRNYLPRAALRKLLENTLHQNKGVNQERGRHKIQEVGDATQREEKDILRVTAEEGREQTVSDWRWRFQEVRLQEENEKAPVSTLTGLRVWRITFLQRVEGCERTQIYKQSESNEKPQQLLSLVEGGKGLLRNWNHHPLVDSEVKNSFRN